MTAPSAKVRRDTTTRDQSCVAGPIGCWGGLEWNHRENSGNGGRGSKAPKVTTADGVMLCTKHNQALESDPTFLIAGLHMGWKVKRNRVIPSDGVPFFHRPTREWRLPDATGGYRVIREALAVELIEAAGGYTTKGVH